MALSVYNSGGSGANSIGNLRTIELSANPSNGGTVSGGGTASDGLSVAAEAFSNSGFKFSKWIESGATISTKTPYIFTVSSNRNLTAEFVEDTLDWHTGLLPNTPSEINYVNNKFIVDGGSKINDYLAYSEDGISWNTSTFPYAGYWRSISYGNGKYVVTNSAKGNVFAYSEDLITWNVIEHNQSIFVSRLAYGAGKFVAVGSSNSSEVLYSADGITWNKASLPSTAKYVINISYLENKFIILCQSDKAFYSTDGIAWNEVSMPSSGWWYNVAYGKGKFIAVNMDTIAAYSTDGISWGELTMPHTCIDIAYGGGLFVGVNADFNSNAKSIYSEDGISWKEAASPLIGRFVDIAYGAGKFIAINGENNTIVYANVE